jgi:hypothetical protein
MNIGIKVSPAPRMYPDIIKILENKCMIALNLQVLFSNGNNIGIGSK